MTLSWKSGQKFQFATLFKTSERIFRLLLVDFTHRIKVWKQVLPSQKGKSTDGENSKTFWERPFPVDTRWLREGTESVTPAEYPWDNEHNRTWLQCRSLIQD